MTYFSLLTLKVAKLTLAYDIVIEKKLLIDYHHFTFNITTFQQLLMISEWQIVVLCISVSQPKRRTFPSERWQVLWNPLKLSFLWACYLEISHSLILSGPLFIFGLYCIPGGPKILFISSCGKLLATIRRNICHSFSHSRYLTLIYLFFLTYNRHW